MRVRVSLGAPYLTRKGRSYECKIPYAKHVIRINTLLLSLSGMSGFAESVNKVGWEHHNMNVKQLLSELHQIEKRNGNKCKVIVCDTKNNQLYKIVEVEEVVILHDHSSEDAVYIHIK